MPVEDVQLLYPWAFAALLIFLVLPRQRGWLWRFVAIALLVAALAQPTVRGPGHHLAVLVDVSASVGEQAIQAADAFDFSGVPGEVEFFYFAEDATRASPGTPRQAVSYLDLEHADFARALQVAQASGADRIFLLSDGIESQGDALSALPQVPVDVFGVPSRPNAGLLGLFAPDEVSPGERVEAVAVVESSQDTDLQLDLDINGQELEPIRKSVPSGRTAIPLRFTAPRQDITLTASIAVDFEQPTADDTRSVDILVTGEPVILVVNDPAMARLLEAQGFSVVTGGPDKIAEPLAYDAVILREGSRKFTPGQLTLLESFVRRGGGLMMTGGENSFGLGEWFRTPVEKVLPVVTDVRSELEFPLVATVLVLDRSSSMRAERPTRISLARQGAVDLVELAHPDDYLGLIAFDHDFEWIFKPRPATQSGKEEMYRAIMRIEPQGGTIVGPPYREAIDVLRETDAAVKHIIILTDGEFFDGRSPFGVGERPDFEAMAASARRTGITTTTIGFGEADFDTIERLARAGGGRFYEVTDTRELPRVIVGEALTAPKALLRDERFTPRLHRHALTRELSPDLGAVDAYVATLLRRDADLLVEGLEGEPLLAIGRYGLGRSAALTTDLNAWAGDMSSWPELPGLVGAVVRWLQTDPQQYSASVSAAGSKLQVVVDAVHDGLYMVDEHLEAHYGDTRVLLEQTGPGRYVGQLDAVTGGTVSVVRDQDIVAQTAVNLPHPAFHREGAGNFLREIVARTGGAIVPEPSPYEPELQSRPIAVWSYLATVGLAMFLLELAYRRLLGGRST